MILNEIVNFLNMVVWNVDGISDMRMFHLILLVTCGYCIYDELKKMIEDKKSEKKA